MKKNEDDSLLVVLEQQQQQDIYKPSRAYHHCIIKQKRHILYRWGH